MLCRRSVIHFAGVSLSCTSPHSPSFFRHDEEILGHDQEHPDRWRHGFATRIERASPCWARVTFQWPLPSGVVPLFAIRAIHLQISTPPPSPCGRGGERRLHRRNLRSKEHQLGISRHRRKEFRHDEIFEIGTQTSSAALGHCQSLVVVVIVLLRLLLPIQVW